jgi:cyclophilin family peptidyl-prolyl cis-trans isomerase
VRRKAAELVAKSGGSPPPVSLAPSAGSPEWALRFEAERAGEPPPVVRLRTSKGDVLLRLFPDEAPLAVESFLRLASQRFYDGLLFHRVVPNWVVQGGDPRGDGWGGYRDRFLLDQFTRRPFLRGTLGVPTSGTDTGGCQIFVCLVPAPNLDSRYTAFGEVTEGLDVLDRIEIGDVIAGIDVLSADESATGAVGRDEAPE